MVLVRNQRDLYRITIYYEKTIRGTQPRVKPMPYFVVWVMTDASGLAEE